MNGVNVFTLNLAFGLKRCGCDVAVVLTDPRRSSGTLMQQPNWLRFINLDTQPAGLWLPKWRSLISLLERHRPCVYFPNYDWHTSCVAPRLSNQIGIISVIHSDERQYYEQLERFGNTWNAVVAVSHHIGRKIEQIRPSTQPKLTVIPNGVKVPEPLGQARGAQLPLRILFAGRFAQFQKRISDVGDIACELAQRGLPYELTLIGCGPDESSLRERCNSLVQRGFVRFTGLLDQEQVFEEFKRHDVFILTSDSEGLPNALLEAMAYSVVPVVSEIESGIPEVVRGGWNGLTAPVGDINTFADQLTLLHEDRGLLAELSARARQTIVDGPFNLDQMVQSYFEVIDRVAEEARSASFSRTRGRIRPPADLGPLWRHHIPQPLRLAWRRLKSIARSKES